MCDADLKCINTSLIFIILQITSVPHLSVSELLVKLSETAAAALTREERERENLRAGAGLVSPAPAAPLPP